MKDFPIKKYDCIMADPPWSYKNNGSGLNGIAERQYKVMKLEDIKNLPVSDISNENSCLFLWAVTPFLPEALDVMKSWGFKYKTVIYWDKINMGMGYWFRGQVEMCLVGIRGNIKPFRAQIRNIIEEKRTKHSKKPEKIYNIIESISSIKTKIELFARFHRQGWDVWGDEIEKNLVDYVH